ncbi:MAG: FAD-dependent oxidoreductase [Thermoleophilia bacterium]|nr:FAD-dependent oxidoreductase [Thermoleophilia bacterium]
MQQPSISRTITEPSRETPVFRETDVLVVGGGPGGVAAAIAAARNGAKVILMERYGYLGGMATGGLVNAIPNLATIEGQQGIAGICQEIIDRLKKKDAVHIPDRRVWGTSDPRAVEYYLSHNYSFFYLRRHPEDGDLRVIYTALADPEILKYELGEMAIEAGVELLLHSWGVSPIMDGNAVRGMIFESKSGRQAVLAQVVIDCTGDGDVFALAGADYDAQIRPGLRISNLAMGCWITNVDIARRNAFRAAEPEKYARMMGEASAIVMSRASLRPTSDGVRKWMMEVIGADTLSGFFFEDMLPNHEDVVTLQPHFPARDQTDVEELTRVEIEARRGLVECWEFLKRNVPGFEQSWIMLTAPQLGTTGGKRLIGEYVYSEEDLKADRVFEDTICMLPNTDTGRMALEHPFLYIPYRALVPRGIEGLLVACRGFSSTEFINNVWNLIPHCTCYGQAAGTAAAMAVDAGCSVHDIDCKALQSKLREANVILPDQCA